jgi:hypothetical protein
VVGVAANHFKSLKLFSSFLQNFISIKTRLIGKYAKQSAKINFLKNVQLAYKKSRQSTAAY